ncbi:hypothetical protein QQX09_11580 [Demequina sp. SYSU T00192]|uniref:Uncharacterized protein n=1 Tax=Demequina litoralis TaxID=3051660 RepID=A0ABT8GBH6_9MICO|nr:hypothetical protein [Demequina sp. SYSU T00192]MDN4476495.1 hypothetical protein [Demequina sp. SYSU T00192]
MEATRTHGHSQVRTHGSRTLAATAALLTLLAGCTAADGGAETSTSGAPASSANTDAGDTSPSAGASTADGADVRIVTDESGRISMLAPVGWEVDGRPRPQGDGAAYVPSLIVWPDINEFVYSNEFDGAYGTFESSGVSVRLLDTVQEDYSYRVEQEAESWRGCEMTGPPVSHVDGDFYGATVDLACTRWDDTAADDTTLWVFRGPPDRVGAAAALRFTEEESRDGLKSTVWESIRIAMQAYDAMSSELGTPTSFTSVTDDSGRISLSVPAGWEVDGVPGAASDDGGSAPALVAAPDIEAFLSTTTAPGVSVELRPDSMTIDHLAASESDLAGDCEAAEPTPSYDDGHLLNVSAEYSCDGSHTVQAAVMSHHDVKAKVVIRGTADVWDADIPSQIWATIALTD